MFSTSSSTTLSGETSDEETTGLAVEVEDIVGEESFRDWLSGQTVDLARLLATRIALRTLPNVLIIHSTDASQVTKDNARKLTLHCFRASFLSWTAIEYPTHVMGPKAYSAAKSAADHDRLAVYEIIESATKSAANAANAADSASSAILCSANSAAFSARSAANSVTTYPARSVAQASIWEFIRTDASTVLMDGTSDVFASPLWPKTKNNVANQKIRVYVEKQITDFKQTEEYTALPWDLWIAWWESLQNDTSHSLFGEIADLEIARKNDEFWDRDVAVVMDELAKIVGWPWGEERKSASPFSFGWSSIGTVTLTGDAFSTIWVPQNRSPDDAANRLAAAKKAAENLIKDLQSGTLQANQAYASGLGRYVDELPGDMTSSIYVADQELRTLRDDLEDDLRSELLDSRFARRLLRVIEAHYGLRPYYPDLLNFYDDVRHGNLTEPPPLQAIADVEQLIRENTPDVFDVSVSQSLQRLEPDRIERPPQSSDTTTETEGAADDQPIALPKDPIADIDPARAEQNAKSATLEKIGGVLSKVEKGAKNVERVEKVAKTYQKFAKPILDFIKGLMENGGDIPPGV